MKTFTAVMDFVLLFVAFTTLGVGIWQIQKFDVLERNHQVQQPVSNEGIKEPSKEELLEKMQAGVKKAYRHVSTVEAARVVAVVSKHAEKEGVDPALVLAVIGTESSFNRLASNSYGASGYMQVVPRWHEDKIKGRNVFSTKVNVEVGVRVLATCLRRHIETKKGLACYNGSNSAASAKRYYYKVARAYSVIAS